MPSRHAIITCCDQRYGDFLIAHWLRSLQKNVDLTGIDVVVLDYGLSDSQRLELAKQQVRCFPCEKNGFVCNLRYRDMCRLFDETPYDQVLSVDSGDVIFQADIRHVFEENKQSFRAAPEEMKIPFHELIIDRRDIRPEIFRRMLRYLENKPTLNAGVVWGPAEGFRTFWKFYQELSDRFDCFGVDQLVLNYMLYREGFVQLDRRYNYVLVSNKTRFTIRDGVFLDRSGRVIPVVHNAGNKDSTRAIGKFGFGSDRNKRKWLLPIGIRLLVGAFNSWKALKKLAHFPKIANAEQ
jgi:hypothetical protein